MRLIYKAEYLGFKTYRLEVDEDFVEMLKEHQLDKMIESAKHVKEGTLNGELMRMRVVDVSEYMKNYQMLYAVLRDGKAKYEKEHPAETECPF